VNLVELSVSHYFLARALESVGLTEKDVKVVNTSDADIVAAWGTADVTAAASWNPQLSEIKKQKDTYLKCLIRQKFPEKSSMRWQSIPPP
jgi:NitT/TauT family transport system substrate-binding protein